MRRLDELYHEASQRDLTYPGAQYTKGQLMDKLAAHYSKERQSELLTQYPVMLARNVKDLPEEQLKKMLEGGEWIAEEKLDGMRAKLHIDKDGNRIDTRHRSVQTYEYCERTLQLPYLQHTGNDFPGTILDGELRMPVTGIKMGKTKTDSYLTSTTATVNSSPERAIEIQQAVGACQYFAFDILFFCGEDIRAWPYYKRYEKLLELHTYCGLIKLPIRCTKGLEVFYQQLIKSGGEGIMLKDLDAPYTDAGPGGCRRPKAMYKMKRHNEVDCFVTGFVPGEGEFSGLIGSLLVSILQDDQAVEIGAIQPGDLDFRRSISEADGSLRDDIYGKVAEVSFLCKTKNSRLRHAVLKRWRPDKTMYECTG